MQPQSDLSPVFQARPRTANPKLVSLSMDSQRAAAAPARGGGFGEGSVLWSQEGVAQEDLVRPPTSNPRYVERLSAIDTPRRDTPGLGPETPSRASNDTTAVLWASDPEGIAPSMIVRPPTSNPWLHSFLDGVPDAKVASAASDRGGEILWSAKSIDDWRMLARPHASNPVYEAGNNAPAAGAPPIDGPASEVLWSSADAVETEATVAMELRGLVKRQAARIAQLELEVIELRAALAGTMYGRGVTSSSAGRVKAGQPQPELYLAVE